MAAAAAGTMAGSINYTHIWLQEIIYGSWNRFKCFHSTSKGFFMFLESSIFFCELQRPWRLRISHRRVSPISAKKTHAKPSKRSSVFHFLLLSSEQFRVVLFAFVTATAARRRNEKNCSSHLSLQRFTMRVSRKRVCSWRRRVIKNCWFRTQTKRSTEINRDI